MQFSGRLHLKIQIYLSMKSNRTYLEHRLKFLTQTNLGPPLQIHPFTAYDPQIEIPVVIYKTYYLLCNNKTHVS